jgi:cytochrome P450
MQTEPPRRPPVTDWATDFDHFAPDFIDDPYPVYAELRDRCPVAHSPRYGGTVVLTTWDDITEAAHDTERFSSRRTIVSEVPTDRRGVILPPINIDPPDHTDRRRILLPFFSPQATARWEEPIRAICERLLDGLEGRTECDAALDYAQEIPGEITATMLGVEVADAPQLRTWIHDLMEVGPTDPALARSTTQAMLGYMHELLADRRENGGDDMVTYLLGCEVEGEGLSDDEMARTLFLLIIAGIDTTWSAIGFALLHLATHPDDRRRLATDPTLTHTAVEEFLRGYSPAYIGRIATSDTEIGGCPIDAGDWTILAFPSANRDPKAFDDPDEIIIDRASNRHAAFGLGVHRCLGSNLARLEMNIAISMWMERFPEFSLTDPDAVIYAAGHVRGPRRIPIRMGRE